MLVRGAICVVLEPVLSPVVLAGLVSNGPSLRVLGYGESTEAGRSN